MNNGNLLFILFLKRAAWRRGRKERSRDVIEVATPIKKLSKRIDKMLFLILNQNKKLACEMANKLNISELNSEKLGIKIPLADG